MLTRSACATESARWGGRPRKATGAHGTPRRAWPDWLRRAAALTASDYPVRSAMKGADEVLLVIDVQNDFMPRGALPVAHGDEVVPVINRLASAFSHVVLTQDWHPAKHVSFAEHHPGRAPFDMATLSYGQQVLWPTHCVQDTDGAALHRDLHVPHARLVIRKGHHVDVDSYSA